MEVSLPIRSKGLDVDQATGVRGGQNRRTTDRLIKVDLKKNTKKSDELNENATLCLVLNSIIKCQTVVKLLFA